MELAKLNVPISIRIMAEDWRNRFRHSVSITGVVLTFMLFSTGCASFSFDPLGGVLETQEKDDNARRYERAGKSKADAWSNAQIDYFMEHGFDQ